jgi:P27 family predicted phage terminase small subunit
MRAGRKPKPTALKLLQGNPGKRPIRFREPKPTVGAPKPPAWLDAYALQEWRRVVPALDKIGILTCVDGFVLEAYCTCYGAWRLHVEIIAAKADAQEGYVYHPAKDEKSTYLQALPQVALARQYLELARSFAGELGLSPSMRTRILAPEVAGELRDEDPLEAFLSHRKAPRRSS